MILVLINGRVVPSTVCARKLHANAYIRRFVAGNHKSHVRFKNLLGQVAEINQEKHICKTVEGGCHGVVKQQPFDNDIIWMANLGEAVMPSVPGGTI